MRGDTIFIPILQIKKLGTEKLKLKVRSSFYDKYLKKTNQVSNANCYEVLF